MILTAVHALFEALLHGLAKIFGPKLTPEQKRILEEKQRRDARWMVWTAVTALLVGTAVLVFVMRYLDRTSR